MEREVVFAERMEVCQNHPERSEIFWLEQMLIKAGYPYFFNFWEDLKPTPFNQDGGDPQKDIDWNTYDFCIDLSNPAGFVCMKVYFEPGEDRELLQITEIIHKDEGTTYLTHLKLTAEQAMEIIEKFFKAAE